MTTEAMIIPGLLFGAFIGILLFLYKIGREANTLRIIHCDPEHVRIIENICDLIDKDKIIYSHHFVYKKFDVYCDTFRQQFIFSNGIHIPLEGEISRMLTSSIYAQKKRFENKALKDLQ